MKSRHITKTLDRRSFAELSDHDLATIRVHNADCADCRRVFEAARISALLLKFEAGAETPSPSPFFQAKVLNALREKQKLRSPVAAFRRWWQASAAMIVSMVMTIVCLVALNALAPSDIDQEQAEASNYNLYSTDTVIFSQNSPRDLTADQAFQLIYARSDADR